MSHHDYMTSIHLAAADPPFAALIMAAMRKADTPNTAILREAYPEIRAELEARYHARGGLLPTETAAS